MEYQVDLCIVGASGAGMTAAVAARQHGVERVLVLEKQKRPGGCTIMSAGIMGVDTPAQKRQGLCYSRDEFFQELMQLFNWNCDALLVRKWINGTGENFEWLEDLGLKYDLAVTETADARRFRSTMHRIAQWDGNEWHMKPHGPFIVRCLEDACARYGVEIRTETRAAHLLKDDAGAVCGVEAVGPDGPMTVRAKAVVLATGSISSNEALIRRFYGTEDYKDVRIMARVPHNTGDGLVMAEEAGAKVGKLSTLFIGPHNHWPGASELIGMLMRRGHNLKVNINGERFADESIPNENEFGWMLSVAVENQPGRRCYAILDQDLMDATLAGEEYAIPTLVPSLLDKPMIGHGGYENPGYDPDHWRDHLMAHIEHEAEAGRAKVCRSIGELARFITCDEQTLEQTITRYNLSCARRYDEDFMKKPEYLYPVAKAPYYVIRGDSGIDTCLGGVQVDSHQRVMRPDGRPIPGLYGAGVVTSGWLAGLYAINGAEMSYVIFSGRSAAKEAADYMARRG